MPVRRAASELPPSLPMVATAITTRQIVQSIRVWRSPISVRKPEKAKKTGRSKTELMFSSTHTKFAAEISAGRDDKAGDERSEKSADPK